MTADSSAFVNGMAIVLEMMAPLREATIGYRAQMIDHGMDDESASRCAADFHRMTIEMTLDAQRKAPKS